MADPDPVVFLEPKKLYWSREDTDLQTREALPFGRAAIRRAGRDATVVAYGPSVPVALAAAEAAAADGIELEVVDLRTLVPFDDETVTESVRRTGRCVVVQEAQGFAGVGAEIAARVQERCFHSSPLPCCGWQASTFRIRRRSWSTRTFPASTGSSTPSTVCSSPTSRTPGTW